MEQSTENPAAEKGRLAEVGEDGLEQCTEEEILGCDGIRYHARLY